MHQGDKDGAVAGSIKLLILGRTGPGSNQPPQKMLCRSFQVFAFSAWAI
jgi:hypothetical protein